MAVLSEKGKKITIKSEVATSLKMPFKEHPVETTEEASKRKFEVIGTDIKTEYKDFNTAAEEEEVGKLNKKKGRFLNNTKNFIWYKLGQRVKCQDSSIYIDLKSGIITQEFQQTLQRCWANQKKMKSKILTVLQKKI